MMTEHERLVSLHERMEARRRRKERGRLVCLNIAGAVLAILLILLVFNEHAVYRGEEVGLYTGATLLFSGAAAHMLTAVIAFCAGVVVTVLCKRYQRRSGSRDGNGGAEDGTGGAEQRE